VVNNDKGIDPLVPIAGISLLVILSAAAIGIALLIRKRRHDSLDTFE
jgi:hypothetical protein